MNQMARTDPNSSTEKEMVALAEEELARLQRQVKFNSKRCSTVYFKKYSCALWKMIG